MRAAHRCSNPRLPVPVDVLKNLGRSPLPLFAKPLGHLKVGPLGFLGTRAPYASFRSLQQPLLGATFAVSLAEITSPLRAVWHVPRLSGKLHCRRTPFRMAVAGAESP